MSEQVSTHTDSEGNPSHLRAMGTLCITTAIAIGMTETIGHLIFNRAVDGNAVVLVGVFLTTYFGGKVGQKFAEK